MRTPEWYNGLHILGSTWVFGMCGSHSTLVVAAPRVRQSHYSSRGQWVSSFTANSTWSLMSYRRSGQSQFLWRTNPDSTEINFTCEILSNLLCPPIALKATEGCWIQGLCVLHKLTRAWHTHPRPFFPLQDCKTDLLKKFRSFHNTKP